MDEPFEPVASFATRLRVVVSRLPQNDFYSADSEPTLLYDADRDNLQVLWTGRRAVTGSPGAVAPAGTSADDVPAPADPTNILYANAEPNLFALDDPLYRGWLWDRTAAGDPIDARALSVSTTPNEHNSSPTAFTDAASGRRWALWHQSLTSAAGAGSRLRFDSSTTIDWDGSDATESLQHQRRAKGPHGFARPEAANRLWMLWHTGPAGASIRFRPEFDPTSAWSCRLHTRSEQCGPCRAGRLLLRRRRPLAEARAEPLTYVRDASAFKEIGDPRIEFAMDVPPGTSARSATPTSAGRASVARPIRLPTWGLRPTTEGGFPAWSTR